MEDGFLAQLKVLLRLAGPNSFTYLINMAIPVRSRKSVLMCIAQRN